MQLHAFTEAEAQYPAYVNFTLVGETVRVTARERGHGGMKSSVVDLSKEEMIRLAEGVLAALRA